MTEKRRYSADLPQAGLETPNFLIFKREPKDLAKLEKVIKLIIIINLTCIMIIDDTYLNNYNYIHYLTLVMLHPNIFTLIITFQIAFSSESLDSLWSLVISMSSLSNGSLSKASVIPERTNHLPQFAC